MKVRFDAETNEMYVNGVQVDLSRSLKVRKHSPSGFHFGYTGSGPSQSALALLLLVTDEATAVKHYQQFKREVIAQLPQTSFEREIDILGWLEGKDVGDEEE